MVKPLTKRLPFISVLSPFLYIGYNEEDGLGSIDFDYRGVPYHIWEFEDGERGVETNLRSGGRQEEILSFLL